MGARWYLACIAVLMLLGVAAHLSVQLQAQKKAEWLLQQWGKQARVQVGDVRYHLLRNGLIVQNIHVIRDGASLSIAHMLIRASPRRLISSTPQIGRIEMDGVQAQLWKPEAENSWQQDKYLQRIWHASRSLSLRGGELVLYAQGKAEPPLKMTGLELKQDYRNQQRSLDVVAQTLGADVQLRWQINEAYGSSFGRLHWQDVDARPLSSALGLQVASGLLTGSMSWTQPDSTQPDVLISNLDGRTQLRIAEDESGAIHQLRWQGSHLTKAWQLQMQAKAWPLDAWADQLPQIGGRHMQTALLDGELQWSGQPGNWNIKADQGMLRHAVYTKKNGDENEAWHIGRLDYKDALINQTRRHIQVSSILVVDSGISLQPAPVLASERQSPEQDWRMTVDKIHIQNMALGLSMQQGKVTVASLDGKGSWKSGEALNFKLKTQAAINKTDVAEADEAVAKTEHWRLAGSVSRNQTDPNESTLNIRARDVPLAKLRALVPLAGSKSSPLTLEGYASLKTNVSVQGGIWQAAGTATAEEVLLAHGGDTWQMDQLSLSFGPVGMGLDSQRIDLLEVKGWKYIAALNPLTAYATEAVAESDDVTPQTAWWVKPLRQQNWRVGGIRLDNGVISLGRSEDQWASEMDIHLNRLHRDQWSALHVVGKIGGGDFALEGSWDALGEVNRFKGAASLQNAQPFFLNNWMLASGMPPLIRGRIYANLVVEDGESSDSYQSSVQLKFLRGLTEMSPSPNDPLLSRIGFATSDTLRRLDDGAGTAMLQFESSGNWKAGPLNLDRLGESMQSALHQAALGRMEEEDLHSPSPEKRPHAIETRIRLHERGFLSLNERSRLLKAVTILRKNPDWVVDLIPHWSGHEINADVLKRVSYTQHLIERYLSHRKVKEQRIFHLWPTVENHSDEIGSIWVSIGPST